MKYLVEIREVHVRTVEVEATSKLEALAKADSLVDSENFGEIEFSHNLPKEFWKVIPKDGE